MSYHTLLVAAVTALSSSVVLAQTGTTTSLEPLASKHFTWPDIPYQVTGDNGGERGPQFGFNLCNSTTENQNSNCQTMFVNDLSDFCMWSSSQTNDTVGESEAREVAWCTKPGHGTRVIPPGAITGAQWLYAKDYVQVVGFIDQTQVNLFAGDEGGELDPHGADEQGNPLGGIVFTNGYGQSSSSFQAAFNAHQNESTQYTQVIEWIDFIGSGMFCLKMCNPSDPNAALLCQHIYDEIGCTYNAIADYNAINGTFEVCDSDDMAFPGIFTTDGQVTTWHQPFTPITTIPYSTTIPSSSNCVTYASSDLYAPAISAFASISTTAATATTTSGTSTATKSSGAGSSGASSGASSSRTSSGSSATNTSTSGASSVRVSFFGLPMLVALIAVILA